MKKLLFMIASITILNNAIISDLTNHQTTNTNQTLKTINKTKINNANNANLKKWIKIVDSKYIGFKQDDSDRQLYLINATSTKEPKFQVITPAEYYNLQCLAALNSQAFLAYDYARTELYYFNISDINNVKIEKLVIPEIDLGNITRASDNSFISTLKTSGYLIDISTIEQPIVSAIKNPLGYDFVGVENISNHGVVVNFWNVPYNYLYFYYLDYSNPNNIITTELGIDAYTTGDNFIQAIINPNRFLISNSANKLWLANINNNIVKKTLLSSIPTNYLYTEYHEVVVISDTEIMSIDKTSTIIWDIDFTNLNDIKRIKITNPNQNLIKFKEIFLINKQLIVRETTIIDQLYCVDFTNLNNLKWTNLNFNPYLYSGQVSTNSIIFANNNSQVWLFN